MALASAEALLRMREMTENNGKLACMEPWGSTLKGGKQECSEVERKRTREYVPLSKVKPLKHEQ